VEVPVPDVDVPVPVLVDLDVVVELELLEVSSTAAIAAIIRTTSGQSDRLIYHS
jgi:hypothetical protein